MTAGGFGYCSGYEAPGSSPRGARGGYGAGGVRGGYGAGGVRGGRGAGGGRGYRHQYFATGLPGWQRADPGRFGGRYRTGSRADLELTDEASEMRAEAQRLEDAATRLRERADAIGQKEERED